MTGFLMSNKVKILLSVVALVLVGGAITAFTGAVFTDVGTSSANTFTSGTLDLKLNGSDSVSAQYNLTAMAPGDGFVVQTNVRNVGNLALRYSLKMEGTSPSSGNLYSGGVGGNGPLKWKIRTLGVAGTCTTGAESEATTTFDTVGGADTTISGNTAANPTVVTTSAVHGLTTGDQVIISGSNSTPSINGRQTVTVLSTTTFSVPVTVTVAGTAGTVTRFVVGSAGSGGYVFVNANSGNVIGSSAQGQDTSPNGGDRLLTATVGSSPQTDTDVLCIKVVLPLATAGQPGQVPTTGFQGQAGTLVFQFDAEQTTNNP